MVGDADEEGVAREGCGARIGSGAGGGGAGEGAGAAFFALLRFFGATTAGAGAVGVSKVVLVAVEGGVIAGALKPALSVSAALRAMIEASAVRESSHTQHSATWSTEA